MMLGLSGTQAALRILVLFAMCTAAFAWQLESSRLHATNSASSHIRVQTALGSVQQKQLSPYELGKFLRGMPQLLAFHRVPQKMTDFKKSFLDKQEMFAKVYQENAKVLAQMTVSPAKAEETKKKLSASLEKARIQRMGRVNRRKPRKRLVSFPDFGVMQVSKLAEVLDMDARQIQRYVLSHRGIVVESASSSIDVSLAKEIARVAGYPVRDAGEEFDERFFKLEDEGREADDSELRRRPPVVTIMGHVDHGKTSLLDTIRKTMVAKTEAGGITQHTNAYQVHTSQGDAITFVDTPGHEAFRAMRERGAKITDVVVLVVAADDGIMTQTKEVINIITSNQIPVVVAITKMDKRDIKPDRILTDLMSYGIVVEDFGGDTQVARVSATRNEGIDELLEKILVQAEFLELKATPNASASGTVIEAQQTSDKGSMVQLVVQQGTLRVGDVVLAGDAYGRIKEIFNSSEHSVSQAGPSTPVHVLGIQGVPKAGDTFSVMADEDVARVASETRQQQARHESVRTVHSTERKSVVQSLKAPTPTSATSASPKQQLPLKVVVKADVQGSLDALLSNLREIAEEDEQAICQVQVVSAAVGAVTKNDVNMAHISKASILAYGVDVRKDALEHARMKRVSVDKYPLLHDAVRGYTEKAKTIIKPPTPGKYIGRATVKQVFMVNKLETVAGCQVVDGVISASARVRVLRGNRNELYRGPIVSLRIVREEVTEVRKGQECGIMCDPKLQLLAGDVIECFEDPNVQPSSK